MPEDGMGMNIVFALHSALADDTHEGRIWIRPADDEAGLALRKALKNSRRLVRIRHVAAARIRTVYVEALYADTFYLRRWEGKVTVSDATNYLFASGWYRRNLGIERAGGNIELEVSLVSRRNLWALLYQYPRSHPQVLVLTTSMLGIIGLGVIGMGLGLLGIKDWLATNILSPYLSTIWPPVAGVACLIGFAITVIGFSGLIRS